MILWQNDEYDFVWTCPEKSPEWLVFVVVCNIKLCVLLDIGNLDMMIFKFKDTFECLICLSHNFHTPFRKE